MLDTTVWLSTAVELEEKPLMFTTTRTLLRAWENFTSATLPPGWAFTCVS